MAFFFPPVIILCRGAVIQTARAFLKFMRGATARDSIYQVLFLQTVIMGALCIWLTTYLSVMLLGRCSLSSPIGNGMTGFQEVKCSLALLHLNAPQLHMGVFEVESQCSLAEIISYLFRHRFKRAAARLQNVKFFLTAMAVVILSYIIELQEPSCGWLGSLRVSPWKLQR